MKRLLVLTIFVLIVLAIIIIEPFRMESPTPEVIVKGEEIPTTQGFYWWSGLLFAQCANFIHTCFFSRGQASKGQVA